MLLFDERGEPEYQGKSLLEQSREPTNSIHIWRREWKLNSGHIGGRQVISPQRQPCQLFGQNGPLSSMKAFSEVTSSSKTSHYYNEVKTDSVQSSSNTCKNYLLKIYSQHGNFLDAI